MSENLEQNHKNLRRLAGEILSTIHVNFLRGTIVCVDKNEFQNLIDQWEKKLLEFNPRQEFETEDCLVIKTENNTTVIDKKSLTGLEF